MTWKPYPKTKPTKKCDYLVYIDKANSNIPDAIDVKYFNGKIWHNVNQSHCPVIFWKPLPKPPKGSWMEKPILPSKPNSGLDRQDPPINK
jgi:hypothetical protein